MRLTFLAGEQVRRNYIPKHLPDKIPRHLGPFLERPAVDFGHHRLCNISLLAELFDIPCPYKRLL